MNPLFTKIDSLKDKLHSLRPFEPSRTAASERRIHH